MRISITYQFFILYKFKNIDINIINYIINMSKKVSFENTDNIKYNHTQYDDFIININEDVDNDYYKMLEFVKKYPMIKISNLSLKIANNSAEKLLNPKLKLSFKCCFVKLKTNIFLS